MPMLVVLGVYISIFWRLKNRPITKNTTNFKRRRRTNIMVISVSITFFLSWLPLNALNFLLDVESINKHSKEVRNKTDFSFVKSPNKFVQEIQKRVHQKRLKRLSVFKAAEKLQTGNC